MNLFVMRHGQAQLTSIADNQRQLTEIGFREAEAMSHWFNEQAIELSHVIVSPYVRAQQTAATFIEGYKKAVTVETSELYVPSANAKQGHDYIDGLIASEEVKGLLVVSHMPFVSYLVESLTAGAKAPLFETCAVSRIDYDEHTMLGEFISITAPRSV